MRAAPALPAISWRAAAASAPKIHSGPPAHGNAPRPRALSFLHTRHPRVSRAQEEIVTSNTASARYQGLGKTGKGSISTRSGVLSDQPYGFGTRFEGKPGTNPEELIAAAHASCFTMATSFALAKAGHEDGTLDTQCTVTLEKDGEGFKVTQSALTLTARLPGISEEDFNRIADDAKANCPISKLLNCEITLEKKLENQIG